MPHSLGFTTSGKEIVIITNEAINRVYFRGFEEFSYIEKAEVLLAMEFLILRERRRSLPDFRWLQILDSARTTLGGDLSRKRGSLLRELGIHSAFEARDYGRNLVHFIYRVRAMFFALYA